MHEAKGVNRPLHVVQFTDTHFFSTPEGRLMGVDTSLTFSDMKSLAAKRVDTPDFYLLTGDLSQDESEDSYNRFAESIADLAAPAYFIPGNHDVRKRMQHAFAQTSGPLKYDTTVLYGPWQIVLLDSHVEGQVSGHLSEAELKRLDEALAGATNKHALVVLHHHPVPCGAAWLDGIGIDNSEEFLSVVDSHKQVRGVLFGHIHQEFDESRNGVRYLATPSTCVQFKPRCQSFTIDPVPPGFRSLKLMPDGQIVTEVYRGAAVAEGLDFTSAGY